MELPVFIIIGIVVLFYVRMWWLRRSHKRRLSKTILKKMKQGRQADSLEQPNPYAPDIHIRSWWLVGAGMLLMLGGLALYTESFLSAYRDYWWIPLGLGSILFLFSID